MLLRMLLREWLRRSAEQAIRDSVSSRGAHQPSSEANGRDGEPNQSEEPEQLYDPLEIEIVLLFSTSLEAGGVIDLLEDVTSSSSGKYQEHVGTWKGRKVAVLVSGDESEALKQLAKFAASHFQPRWLVSLGFATALDPRLKRGDVLMAKRVCNENGDRFDLGLQVEDGASEAQPGVWAGNLLTAAKTLRSPEERQQCFESSQSLAADLEAFHLAAVCVDRGQPFLAIKIISETQAEEPPKVLAALERSSSLAEKLGAVVGSVWREPSTVKTLFNERQRAIELADRLGSFVGTMLKQLS